MKYRILGAALLLMVSMAAGQGVFDSKGKAAVISLSGQIKPDAEGLNPTGITPRQVRELTDRAHGKGVDAIIYEFNSGGGAVVASKEVMRSIDAVEKPTVCRIRDIGASGAYLASLGCDRTVADSASLTGSVGVKASYLEFSGLLERFGVEYVNLTSGEFKDTGSRYRNLTPGERELLQQKIDTVHQQFLNQVEEERNLSQREVEEVGTGQAFLGVEAKQLGLVDQLGGRKTALEAAENLTGEELRVVRVEQRPGFNLLSLLVPEISVLNLLSTEAPLKSRF